MVSIISIISPLVLLASHFKSSLAAAATSVALFTHCQAIQPVFLLSKIEENKELLNEYFTFVKVGGATSLHKKGRIFKPIFICRYSQSKQHSRFL